MRGWFWSWVVLVSFFSLFSVARSAAQPSAPPSKGPVIPNVGLITADVVKHSILSIRALKSGPELTVYTLVLEVRASEGFGDVVDLVKAGDRIEVFSKEPLPPDVTGKTIRAAVRLRGDEWGQRYWLQEIRSVTGHRSER